MTPICGLVFDTTTSVWTAYRNGIEIGRFKPDNSSPDGGEKAYSQWRSTVLPELDSDVTTQT